MTRAWTCRRCCLLLLLLLLSVLPLPAEELGASLQLEGRVACQRGVTRLLSWQQPDGSWASRVELTAPVAMALAAVAPPQTACHEARRRAQAFLQTTMASEQHWLEGAAAAEVAAVVRLLRREDQALPPGLAERLHELVAVETADMDADAMGLLEALLLIRNQHPTDLALARTPAALAARIQADAQVQPGMRLAARAAMGEDCAAAALPRLAELAEGRAGQLQELYWLARVLYAQRKVSAPWRAQLLAAVLERQRGDGAWGDLHGAVASRLAESAAALQIVALVLAE